MNQQNHPTSNFWFGFMMGALGGSAIMYLLGTEKGREALRNILEHTENFDQGAEDIIKYFEEVSNILKLENTNLLEEPAPSLDTLIDRVKHIGDPKKAK